MDIPAKYNPAEVEDKWYKYWMEQGFFHSEPDDKREAYSMVIPPPNVTGVLHMGHMLNNTIQDVLVRRARMLGKNACWVPGTDHASIATEAKVVARLKEKGIDKKSLTREEFLKHAWEWTEEHGGIILEQLKKLGASCDWDRVNFTMDEAYSESVIRVFVDLYNKEKIYRGVRMVNWDPQAKTAISDEEVMYKEVQSKLYYLRYRIEESPLTPEGGTEEHPKYETARNSSYNTLKELAKKTKANTTEAEAILWEHLKSKQLDDYKFRRQHIIDEFIVDFVCLSRKVVVEIDGGYHNDPDIIKADNLRAEILASLGYEVIRFTNEEIFTELEDVLVKLTTALNNSPLGGRGAFVLVATTRPETILGDTAVCVNPNDPRYAKLKGKRVIVPLINRPVPVIMDEYVDMEFGTGALKITPAHDVNDYLIGEKFRLESIDIFNDDGTLNEKAQLYVGMDRFAVRKQIEQDLDKAGLLEKTEDYTNKVGYSERTSAVIEPKLSMQWFVSMKELAQPALEAVMDDEVMLYPPKFKNTYRHWMENVKDWCISRQLWWGHRIPAWYLPDGGFVVAENEHDALRLAKEKDGNSDLQLHDLRQDEDCLDTWFSSWLWPISVFDPKLAGCSEEADPNNDFMYYYPTADLVTAPEILFFWVARMIIAGYEWAGGYPFRSVYLTGIVRDKQGRKMSKSLGNSPDPLKLIEQFSADGVRMGMLLASPAGNDILFDDSLCEQGRNFNNKIWNAFRLVQTWTVDEQKPQPDYAKKSVEWFSAMLDKTIVELNDDFDKYRLSEALMKVYKLFWDEFSSWYLELIKPPFGEAIDGETYRATLILFDELLRLLHPFMPFITEELWHFISPRKEGESIMVTRMPRPEKFSEELLESGERMKELVTGVRNVRKERNIAQKEALELFINGKHEEAMDSMLMKMGNLSKLTMSSDKPANAASFLVGTTEYHIPLGDMLNVEEELKKLGEEVDYLKGFLVSVEKKLNNEKFMAGAPEQVVASERKKQADAEAKIKTLEGRISELSK